MDDAAREALAYRLLTISQIKELHGRRFNVKLDPTDYYKSLSSMTDEELENVLFNLRHQTANLQNNGIIKSTLKMLGDTMGSYIGDPNLGPSLESDEILIRILTDEFSLRGINFPSWVNACARIYEHISRNPGAVGRTDSGKKEDPVQGFADKNESPSNLSPGENPNSGQI
jgi:hypothetical protein